MEQVEEAQAVRAARDADHHAIARLQQALCDDKLPNARPKVHF